MMAGFYSPNYTQAPNVFFDEMMAQMGEAELRVALVIMRETFGWHRAGKVMSLSYLQKATGMSRQGVKNGIDAGIARGIFWREASGDSFEYGLVVNEVDHPSQRSRPGVVNEVDTTKKEKEKTTNKDYHPAQQETSVSASGSGGGLSLSDVYAAYENNIGMLTPMTSDMIADNVTEYGAQWIVDAIAIAVKQGKRNLSYVEGILRRWRADGRNDAPKAPQVVEGVVEGFVW